MSEEAAPIAPEVSKEALLSHLRKIENVGEFTKKEIKLKLLEDFQLEVSGVAKDDFMMAIQTVALEQNPSAESEGSESEGEESSEEGWATDEDPVVAEAPASWKARFGELMWVMSFKMWWPCYVFNPSKLSKRAGIRKNAIKKVGKEHCVYYYGTNKGSDFGFCKEGDKIMKPYADAETREKALAQKITSKKSKEQFNAGVVAADKEAALETKERVAWLFPELKPRAARTPKTAKKPKAAAKSAAPKKASSTQPKKEAGTTESSEEASAADPVTADANATEPSAASKPKPKPAMKAIVEEEEPEPEEEEEEEEEEFDEDFVSHSPKNKKEKKDKKDKKEKKEKSQKRERERDDEKPAAKKPKSVIPKTPAAPNVAAILATETPADRAKRLVALLTVNTSAKPCTADHSAKAVKTMEKLKAVCAFSFVCVLWCDERLGHDCVVLL
jgi:hypothetical protein